MLVSAGVPWTVEDVCVRSGPNRLHPFVRRRTVGERVAARDSRNAIFSRRMVYEANLSRQRADPEASAAGDASQRFCLSKIQANVEQASSKCRAKP